MLQPTVWHHAQCNADADVVWEILTAGFLVAVDSPCVPRSRFRSRTSKTLAAGPRCASTRSVQDQSSPCLQALLRACVHLSREGRHLAQHDLHAAELRGARCLRLREGCVEHLVGRSLRPFQEQAQRFRARRCIASKDDDPVLPARAAVERLWVPEQPRVHQAGSRVWCAIRTFVRRSRSSVGSVRPPLAIAGQPRPPPR